MRNCLDFLSVDCDKVIVDRYLQSLITKSLGSKILLISGPRQVGKTTLARSTVADHEYLNWDNLDHRRVILARSWSRQRKCVIFDELHKMPRWKGWLKGIYDVERGAQQYIVTGSARLNTYRKVGDSLAGRFFAFTLHPFDLKEGSQWFPASEQSHESSDSLTARLLRVGGFPEPFLNGAEEFYKMWRRSHQDIVLRQDLIDLRTVQEIGKIELLMEHLRSSVGSPISYHAIGEDLQVSDNTVKSWVDLLEELYIVFRVTPYSKNVKRAVLKSPKIYFYDCAVASNGSSAPASGAAFENLVACALLKEIDYRNESGKGEYKLHYLRNRDGAEIDFLILKDRNPLLMLEVKTADESPTKHFKSLGSGLKGVKAVQIVKDTKQARDYPFGVSVVPAAAWLRELSF